MEGKELLFWTWSFEASRPVRLAQTVMGELHKKWLQILPEAHIPFDDLLTAVFHKGIPTQLKSR
jgi:hypothetical protein